MLTFRPPMRGGGKVIPARKKKVFSSISSEPEKDLS
jgi:hypothetical protein